MSSISAQTMSEAANSTPPLSFRLQPDSRQVLSRKRARELLAPLSEAAYTSISLGGCALGDAAAGVAGPALVTLANKKCIRSVAFSDCIASLSQDEALRSLSALSSSIGIWKGLVSVDLSYNALGSRGVAACAPLLQGQRRLEELYLVESGLAAESVRLLQGYLCMGPETKLRTLQVHANRLESKGLNYLSAILDKSPSLERLRLSSLGAAAPAVRVVASALKGKSSLRELDLSDNLLDLDAAQELAAVIPELPNLERLILRDLDMGDDALSVILAALSENPCSLSELALSGNELSPGAGPAVAVFLRSCPNTLRILDLSRNELGEGAGEITDALEEISEDEKKPVLTHLILAANDISSLTIVKLALKLASFQALQCFDISGNQIPEYVREALSTALGSHVVLCDGLATIDDGEQLYRTGQDDNVELDQALRELAIIPCAIPKPSLDGKPALEPTDEPAADGSSSQSRSAVSRLVSLFSRGVNGESKGSENPSSQVIVEDSGPIDQQEDAQAERGGAENIEDDSGNPSGQREIESSTATTTGREVEEITVSTAAKTDDQYVTAENAPSTPVGNVSSASTEVIQSAKKLKESIVSLSKEIAEVTGELQIPVTSSSLPSRGEIYSRSSTEADGRSNVNELLGGALPTSAPKASEILVEILGGLLVAVFVVTLVLGIAQSQEESTFTYRLV